MGRRPRAAQRRGDDGFLRSGDNDEFAVGYYEEDDLPFLPAAAQAFTTYDRFFCSLLASTFPQPRVDARGAVLRQAGQLVPGGARLPRHDDLRCAAGQGRRLALPLQPSTRTTSTTLLVAGTAVAYTANRHGAFVAGTRDESLLLAQTFSGVAAVTALLLAAVVAERRQAEAASAPARSQEALEINDNIIQGLAVARYAVQAGRRELAADALDRR